MLFRSSEQLRPDVAEARRVWIEQRQPDMANMLERLVFIDESVPLMRHWSEQPTLVRHWFKHKWRRRTLKTNLVKTTGWAPVGARLVDHAPFGHWMEAWMRHRFERHADARPRITSGAGSEPHRNHSGIRSDRWRSCPHILKAQSHSSGKRFTGSFSDPPHSEKPLQEPMTNSGKKSETSATSSRTKNATTSSKPPDMKPIERNRL